jgi:type I restriction enzyme M protein
MSEIEEAKKARDFEKRKVSQKELWAYLKQMDQKKKIEARALVKERFPYLIFLYEAEKVGITATGESDYNELYANDKMPPGVTKTAVELYFEYLNKPESFLTIGAGT